MSGPPDALLRQLADAARLQATWRDAQGRYRRADPDTMRTVLEALDLPCASPALCRDSLHRLQAQERFDAGLHIVRHAGRVILPRSGSTHYRLLLEDGTCIMGAAQDIGGGRVAIAPIRRPGYHRLEMGAARCTIAAIPPRAPSVEGLMNRWRSPAPGMRNWVLGAQVYSLRRAVWLGVADAVEPSGPAGWEAGGDFSLVGALARQAGAQGAAGLAISPVHAMFSADAARYSPYAPSSRLFLNVMYADPLAVFDAGMMRRLDMPRGDALVDADGCMDWPVIHGRRLMQLRRLFKEYEATQPPGPTEDFDAFRREGGEALESHACYEALHAHFAPGLGGAHGWRDWPADYHDPGGKAVRRFSREQQQAVRFHVFLQWLAARSLAAAQAEARAAMPIGLIADMAVGTDPRGSHAWCRQEQIMAGVSVGAPPDAFQPQGQDWGLTAFSPWALRRHGYGGFIETLRAVLAHAGGLRVDHVMGLARMWLVPSGAAPSQGIYLGYPMEDLMDLLMLEAWRHDAVVVGENLGTVPEGFDEALTQRGFLGMNVLWFEREAGERPVFRPPEKWPAQTMAMATTHDLPTLCGWWAGRDIQWRERQGECDGAQAAARQQQRANEKRGLWAALQAAGIVPQDAPLPDAAPAADLLAYIASTPAVLLNVALEDVTGQAEQTNLPGAACADPANRHPNWRRTLDFPVEDLLRRGDAPRLLRAIRRARGQQDPQGSAA